MSKNEFICDCHPVNRELVEQVYAAMPSPVAISGVAELFRVMGDPTRCRLIFALLQHEMCVCDLASLLSMTKSSISHQLRKLRESGIVKCRRDGKEVYYSLDDDHVVAIVTATMAHISHQKDGGQT